MADKQGKRVAAKAEKPKKEKKSPAAKVLLVLVLLVIGGYLGLCGWLRVNFAFVGKAQISALNWEGTNLTKAELKSEMEHIAAGFGDAAIHVTYGNRTVSFDRSVIDIDVDEVLDAFEEFSGLFFFRGGITFLHSIVSPDRVQATHYSIHEIISPVNQALYEQKIAEISALVAQDKGQTQYDMAHHGLQISKGTSYQTLDEDELRVQLSNAGNFLTSATVEAPVTVLSANEFDLAAVAKLLYVEPKNAVFDLESKSILPHVTGISLDVAAAQAKYDAAADGSRFVIPLTLTEPEVTTEALEASLFRDVLGTSDTYVGGVANRVSNVRLMANAVNEMVLLPGEVFSYLAVMNANRSGLLDAPVYVRGETVEDLGGGVCQVSSMLYYCAFHANLRVVQRAQHAYVVGYIRDGLDATVFNPAPDFQFENDTEYPIKIVSVMEGRNLSISIMGTKTDDWVVSFERAYSDSNPYETKYEFSDAIPIGKVEEAVSGYTGVKVVVWKVIHDGEGNLISRTLESTNNYRRRDRILIINPADAAQHGQELPEGTVLPTPEVPEIPVPIEPIEPTPEAPPVEPVPEATPAEGIPAV